MAAAGLLRPGSWQPAAGRHQRGNVCPSVGGCSAQQRPQIRCRTPAAGRMPLRIACVVEAPDSSSAAASRRPRKAPAIRQKKGVAAEKDISESGMLELPRPAEYQQTLVQSFTLGGVGLHTGEFAYVRVRPAFAGEGRYFVQVPAGTNCDRFKVDEPEFHNVDEQQVIDFDPELEQLKIQLFTDYLAAQEEEGFDGTFEDFVRALDEMQAVDLTETQRKALLKEDEAEPAEESLFELEPEDIVARSEWEPALSATIDNVTVIGMPYTQLGPRSLDADAQEEDGEITQLAEEEVLSALEGDLVFKSVEMLLSALEACGVDSARIEIEGGQEVPVLDGSAMGWALHIQQAGLRPAPLQSGKEGLERKYVLMPTQSITVQNGDAFVTLYPSTSTKLTAGIDVQAVAPIIGQQWYSWNYNTDFHYRYELAPARAWAESLDELIFWRNQGFMRAGTENTHVIGYGDRWWDPENVRFYDDEPSRHALLDLIGDLALLGIDGNMGIPSGHIVAYNATHAMHIEFARALYASASDEEWVEVVLEDPEDADEGAVEADEIREPGTRLPSRLRAQNKETVSGQMSTWVQDEELDGEDDGEYDEEEEEYEE